MHKANGFGSLSGRPMNVYADEGYTSKKRFAPTMIEIGYLPVAVSKQRPPSKGFIRPEGALLIGSKFCCIAAIKLLQHRFLEPLDNVDNAAPAVLRQRQDLVDAISPFIMPTNGKPYITRRVTRGTATRSSS